MKRSFKPDPASIHTVLRIYACTLLSLAASENADIFRAIGRLSISQEAAMWASTAAATPQLLHQTSDCSAVLGACFQRCPLADLDEEHGVSWGKIGGEVWGKMPFRNQLVSYSVFGSYAVTVLTLI